MTADRINRLILVSLLGICLFFLLDCYVLPLDTSKGVLVTKTESATSKLRVAIYRIQTQRTLITVPSRAYSDIKVNDTIEVGRSLITHSIQKVSVYKNGNVYTWRTGFVALGGLDFLVLLIASNSIYLFFIYGKLERMQMRRDITIFLSFLSLLFMVFYFLFQ